MFGKAAAIALDFDSGFGFVDAVKALTVVRTLRVTTD
jgi:hypothetical protein